MNANSSSGPFTLNSSYADINFIAISSISESASKIKKNAADEIDDVNVT